MYATRSHAALVDENKAVDSKAGAKKATRGKAVHAATRNRRALGDIGNVVSEVQNHVQKDRLKEPVNAHPSICARSSKSGIPPLPPASKRAAKQQDSKCIDEAQHITEEKSVVALASISGANVPVAYNTRARAQKAKKREKTLTAILTAQSEAICAHEEPIENIDEADVSNPLAVADYVEDIYSFYRRTEIQSYNTSDYMSTQADINEKMRAILIDWLIEVHLKFKLMPETLFLTVNLIDRYLACTAVSRKYLQLVGVTAMLLASKYEEIWAPEVENFMIISDDAYTRQQILDMEKTMLNTLRFNLTVPTPYVFLVRFLKAAKADDELGNLAFFLVELCFVEYSMVKFPPSMLAAAAVYTAQCTLQKGPSWSRSLRHHSCYREEQLKECATMMVEYHKKAAEGSLTVVYRKYASSKFSSVSRLSPLGTLPA